MKPLIHNSSRTCKAIILGAGRDGDPHSSEAKIPRCLAMDPFGNRVLDWILTGLRGVHVQDITFVGGYQIQEIGDRYSKLNYIYNPDWEVTGVLGSLFHAREELQGDALISYADIVYRPEACQSLLDLADDGITIAVDSSWEQDVTQASSPRKNLVVLDGSTVVDIGFLEPGPSITAEFVGLVHFGPKALQVLQSFLNSEFTTLKDKPFEQAEAAQYGYMTDLLRHFLHNGHTIRAVDIKNKWAEIEQSQDLARFVLGTKGETLERLATQITKGHFCDQKVYSLSEWVETPDRLLQDIQSLFSPNPIVVRSSTQREDSWHASYAGAFTSVLDIDPRNRDEIRGAIELVVASYSRNDEARSVHDQILVQHMVQNTIMSGVVLTRDMDTGAPYYLINYDDESTSTDAVTSGAAHRTKSISIYRYTDQDQVPELFQALLAAVKELEEVTASTCLDIEFAINKQQEIFILQTRPLAVVAKKWFDLTTTERTALAGMFTFLEESFTAQSSLYGDTTIYGDMPDWNPAEMIGTHPTPLALSLYHELITESAWREARARIGYHHPRYQPLMRNIGGHPFIDVRCSFNSLLPATLPDELSNKLVNFYLDKLKRHPDAHDKIEFEICFTCMDAGFDQRSKELLDHGFSNEEVQRIKSALHGLTENIISGDGESISALMANLTQLEQERQQVVNTLHQGGDFPNLVCQLLDTCRELGTVPFSILARYAFIANSFLKSFVSESIISRESADRYMHSIKTVATELIHDMGCLKTGQLPLDSFLLKYGHLRPGTYDITSYRYDERPDFYFSNTGHSTSDHFNQHDESDFAWTPAELSAVDEWLINSSYMFTATQLFAFMHDAMAMREKAKFEFTRTVSEILKLISEYGQAFEFKREDLSFLPIQIFRKLASNPAIDSNASILSAEIDRGRSAYHQGLRIQLPSLICTVNDARIVRHPASRPNFVTLGKVIGPIHVLQRSSRPSDLEGKIAVIAGADPGYDWIFGTGLTGLLTKYGGAASHMTIRAAEFGLPAAIGCGDALYDQLCRAQQVELDCAGGVIRVL